MTINNRKLNIKNCFILLLIITSAILLILTPHFVEIENQHRAMFGIGGEALIWMFPISMIGFLK